MISDPDIRAFEELRKRYMYFWFGPYYDSKTGLLLTIWYSPDFERLYRNRGYLVMWQDSILSELFRSLFPESNATRLWLGNVVLVPVETNIDS